jgi:hypothetical protein
MQLICFNIDHIIDFITNSSSELFVMKSDNKDIVISLIESVFPDFRKGFHEPMQYKDMPEDIFAKCIETIYDSYAKEKEDLFLFSGFSFEEQIRYDEVSQFYDRKISFLKENKETIISQIDPNNLLWFLVPKEEHEYIYEELSQFGTAYFMSM